MEWALSNKRTMNMRIQEIFAILLIAAGIFIAAAAADVNDQSSSEQVSLIGMANPSAVWAEQMGYEYHIRTNPDGSQYGVCVLPDGSEHDSWRTFREFCGISKPVGISMIQPASPRAILSPKETFGEAHFSARLAALTP